MIAAIVNALRRWTGVDAMCPHEHDPRKDDTRCTMRPCQCVRLALHFGDCRCLHGFRFRR